MKYIIDQNEYIINTRDNQTFSTGSNIVLSNEKTDITFSQKWYNDGYSIKSFLSYDEFVNLKSGITDTITKIINEITNVDTNGFTLEKYHNYIKTNDDHYKVVSKTRDLFPNDFNFDIKGILPKFESILGFPLNDVDPETNKQIHIILRINRPNSTDYNPPHKDMYEFYDSDNYFPQFLNFWVPIEGVTKKSSLPIVPNSHRLPENLILRTTEGGVMSDNKYRVRFIKSWNGKNDLVRTNVTYGEVLIFSSHLVHGLAINDESDVTRVALEFRLFKKHI